MIKVKDNFGQNRNLEVSEKEIDLQAGEYQRIVKLAERAGLISMAAGGIVVLMHPRTQLENDKYHKIQKMTGNGHRITEVQRGGPGN